MKRILLIILLISFTVGALAQLKVARMKQNYNFAKVALERGDIVVFSENKNGTIIMYFDLGGDEPYLNLGSFSRTFKNKYIEDTGYYIGLVKDPVDDYVNVRKGPGTNYPVVAKFDVYSDEKSCPWIYFQKTESNWFKVYVKRDDFEFYKNEGHLYGICCYLSLDPSDYCEFIGYIYKDRVRTPKLEWGKGFE